MDSNGLKKQHQLTFESSSKPSRRAPPSPTSPRRRWVRLGDDSLENGSPENRSISGELNFASLDENSPVSSPQTRGSPEIKGMVLFDDSPVSSRQTRGSPSKMSPMRSPARWSPMRSLAGGSPSKRSPSKRSPARWSPMRSLAGGSPMRSLAGGSPMRSPSKMYIRKTIQKASEFPQKEKFIEQHFVCSPNMEAKSAKALDSLKEFCEKLEKDTVFTRSPQPHNKSSSPIIGRGSFFEVRKGFSPKTVEKTANIGSNQRANLDPESTSSACMTKKDMLELLHAIRKSHGNPQVARVFGMKFSHLKKDDGVLIVEQEACSPLPKNSEGLIGMIQCIIALYRAGLPVSDVKLANFMVKDDGRVVCVDLDLREPKKGVYKLVVSGEYTHTIGFDVSSQFQQLLLVFLETLGYPIIGDRKPSFRALYEQKGLLQSYSLLLSDRSIYETTIEDFREVLRNIGLSEEDNDYLVGLIVPPASSQ
jgi:hypothetical protein